MGSRDLISLEHGISPSCLLCRVAGWRRVVGDGDRDGNRDRDRVEMCDGRRRGLVSCDGFGCRWLLVWVPLPLSLRTVGVIVIHKDRFHISSIVHVNVDVTDVFCARIQGVFFVREFLSLLLHLPPPDRVESGSWVA